MAKCTITITDLGPGNVSVVATPSCRSLAQKDLSHGEITLGEGLTLFAMNQILERMKLDKKGKRSSLILPNRGIGRPL